jgi:hypothetical protein
MDDEYLLKSAQLGIETEKFLLTDLGQHLQKQSELDLQDGFTEFMTADPNDAKAITAIQNKCLLAMKFKQWLNDAIHAGQQATQELTDYDN